MSAETIDYIVGQNSISHPLANEIPSYAPVYATSFYSNVSNMNNHLSASESVYSIGNVTGSDTHFIISILYRMQNAFPNACLNYMPSYCSFWKSLHRIYFFFPIIRNISLRNKKSKSKRRRRKNNTKLICGRNSDVTVGVGVQKKLLFFFSFLFFW